MAWCQVRCGTSLKFYADGVRRFGTVADCDVFRCANGLSCCYGGHVFRDNRIRDIASTGVLMSYTRDPANPCEVDDSLVWSCTTGISYETAGVDTNATATDNFTTNPAITNDAPDLFPAGVTTMMTTTVAGRRTSSRSTATSCM